MRKYYISKLTLLVHLAIRHTNTLIKAGKEPFHYSIAYQISVDFVDQVCDVNCNPRMQEHKHI